MNAAIEVSDGLRPVSLPAAFPRQPRGHTFRLLPAQAMLALLATVAGAVGQGTVNFSTRVTGIVVAKVYQPDGFLRGCGNTASDTPSGTQTYSGALVTGSGWRAQLWAVPGADQPESALQPGFPTTTFRTGATLGGTVAPVTAILAGVPVDCPVATVQMRVWPSQYATWQEAEQNWPIGGANGKSCLFNVYAIGGGTNALPNLEGFRSFSLGLNQLDTPVQPVIYVQPQSQSAPPGGTVVLTAEAACPAILAYEWTFNGARLVAGVYENYFLTTNLFAYPPPASETGKSVYVRSTDAALGFPATNFIMLTNLQPSQAGVYALRVTNLCCGGTMGVYPTTTSSNAFLTVGNPGSLRITGFNPPVVMLDWDGVFFLQSATNAAGPFTDLPGPVVFGPYTNTDFSGPRFFRLRN